MPAVAEKENRRGAHISLQRDRGIGGRLVAADEREAQQQTDGQETGRVFHNTPRLKESLLGTGFGSYLGAL